MLMSAGIFRRRETERDHRLIREREKSMAIRLAGKPVSDALQEELQERIRTLREHGVDPAMMLLRVGERDDDLSYERTILKRCEKLGIQVRRQVFPEDCTQEELTTCIRQGNADSTIHGIMLFRPLPKHLNEQKVIRAIDYRKDIDSVTRLSMAGIYADDPKVFPPCTAEAVMRILDHYQIPLEGKRTVIVGRSQVIGKPAAMLLMKRNATITVCHSRTLDLPKITKEAEIVVAAIGRPEMLDGTYFSEGQTIIDVGIHFREDGSMCGDVKYDEAEPAAAAVTPVPGGVGSVTTSVLLEHVVRAAENVVE